MSTVLVGIVAYVLFMGWICMRLKKAGDCLPTPCNAALVRLASLKRPDDSYALTWH
jgi:hypothetical protein